MPAPSAHQSSRGLVLAGAATLVTLATACGTSEAARTSREQDDDSTLAGNVAPASVSNASARAALRFVVAPSGNEARYRVRELLAGRDLPNDAVGATSRVSGSIAVDSTGAILPGQSRFVVDVASLRSDRDRRDGYVRGRLLETDEFPTVTLVPTAIRGLPASLAEARATVAPQTLQLTGDLTVHGVTRPTAWRVTGRYQGGRVTGTASTAFTFADFGLTQPRVPVLLSVADTIRLEYDFTLVADGAAGR